MTTTPWRATYARRHARVEIERPQRPPTRASVLAVIDAEIARHLQYVAPTDERPMTAALRKLRLTTLQLQRARVLRGWPAADELPQLVLDLALELERRTR